VFVESDPDGAALDASIGRGLDPVQERLVVAFRIHGLPVLIGVTV
jgi:hypothetical protein